MAERDRSSMNEKKVRRMVFAGVYPLYIQKAQKKGRTKEEVDAIKYCILSLVDMPAEAG